MKKTGTRLLLMRGKIMETFKSPFIEFFSFDKDIIKYMVMHWIGGKLLIYSSILPVFMYMLDIDILKAGIYSSIAAISDIILTYILSRFFDRISPNVGMALDWFTEGFPALIYGFASSSIHFLLGGISGRVTNVLNPVYKIYENEIYPEEKRSLIYTYHLMTPEIFTVVFYPIIGYLLTYVFPTITAFRIVFLICGGLYFFVSLIPLKALRWVEPVKIPNQKKINVKFSKELYLTASAETLLYLGLGFISTLTTAYYILDKMNGSVMDIIMLEVLGSATVIFTGLFTKNLSSWISEEKTAQIGIYFFIGFSILMILGNNYYVIITAYLLKSIANTIWFPSHNALLMRQIPKEKRGQFFGSVYSLQKLLAMILPVLSSFLASKIGYFVPFTLGFVCFLSVNLIYQLLLSNNKFDIKA